MNALAVLEQQMQPLAPRFAEVLGPTMPVERLMRTVMVSCERLPKLLECDRQSIFNAAMSAAVLGLEVDGVTGQAFLIPFKGRAQLVVGYKGYNTLAARSGITITGAVVREGDAFDFDKGEGWITHKPLLGKPGRRLVAAWAKASANGRPSVIEVMDVDELQAVKRKSPGAARSDSPWNDTDGVGYPAMCEKTVKRRLARSMPLNVMQMAARIDEAVDEQGRAAWIDRDKGVVVEGEIIAPREHNETPTAEYLIGSQSPQPSSPPQAAAAAAAEPSPPSLVARADGEGGGRTVPSADDYVLRWEALCETATKLQRAQLASSWNEEKELRDLINWPNDEMFLNLKALVLRTLDRLKEGENG